MEFNQYNTTVQQWIHTVLENRETNADVVLECCRDIIAYGRKTDDSKLMGFGFFYGGRPISAAGRSEPMELYFKHKVLRVASN